MNRIYSYLLRNKKFVVLKRRLLFARLAKLFQIKIPKRNLAEITCHFKEMINDVIGMRWW